MQGIQHVLAILALALVFQACSQQDTGEGDKGRKLARVYDAYLYEDDLKAIIPEDVRPEDSANLAKTYIDKWIRQALVSRKAELNLDQDQKDVEELIEQYRRDLVEHMYKKELIRQKLDTAVSNQEIGAYYASNSRNFELKENIVRVSFAKFEKDAPGLIDVRKWYKSNEEEDLAMYKEHCHQNSISFFMEDSIWMPLDNLLRNVPVDETLLYKKKFHEIEDSSYFYFVAVREMKVKESISPLDYEKENIRQIIINKRKVRLLEEMEHNVYQEALKKNDFDIYEEN